MAAVLVQIGGSLFIQHQFASTLQQIRLEWDKIVIQHAKKPGGALFKAYSGAYPGMKGWFYAGREPLLLGVPPETPPPAEDAWLNGRYHMVLNIPDIMTVAIPYEEVFAGDEFKAARIEAVMGVGRELEDGFTSEGPGPIFKPTRGGVWTKPWIMSFYLFESSPAGQKAVAYLRMSPQAIYQTLVSAQPLIGKIAYGAIIAAMIVIFLLAGTAVGYASWIILRTTHGISRVADGVKRFTEGDMEYRIRHKGRDELAQLATSFNRMAESLKSYIDDEVSRAQEKKELELAVSLQNRLFPAPERLHSLGEVSIHFNPSKMVGGDYYDYFYHNGLDYVLIGDASGHGLAASLVMAMAKTAISSLLTKQNRPEEVLPQAHEILKQAGMAEQYVTLQLACIDRRKGSFRIFNAGHPPAYYISKGVVRSLRLDSFPIGIFDGPSQESLEVNFQPGDLLFLYTDGLYEVFADDDQYGLERLESILKIVPSDPHLAVEKVLADVESFKGANPFEDDLTIICIKLTAAR